MSAGERGQEIDHAQWCSAMMPIVCQRRYIVWILVLMPAIAGYSRTGSGGEDGYVGESQKMTLAACCERDPGKGHQYAWGRGK